MPVVSAIIPKWQIMLIIYAFETKDSGAQVSHVPNRSKYVGRIAFGNLSLKDLPSRVFNTEWGDGAQIRKSVQTMSG